MLVLVQGQGRYVQPPEDNHNLALDPYLAARYIFVNCSYESEVDEVMITYKWTKDGGFFDPGGLPGRATVSVPNGDYSSSIEGIYSCTALVDGIPTTESRKTNVTLPGKWQCHVFTFHILNVYREFTDKGIFPWVGWTTILYKINQSFNQLLHRFLYLSGGGSLYAVMLGKRNATPVWNGNPLKKATHEDESVVYQTCLTLFPREGTRCHRKRHRHFPSFTVFFTDSSSSLTIRSTGENLCHSITHLSTGCIPL